MYSNFTNKTSLGNILARVTILMVVFLTGSVSFAQTLYWVGDGGSWNDASHWSATSGGVGNAGTPTSSTAVIFDANSFSTSGQTVTLTTGAICATMNWTGVSNTPTLDLANDLTVSGSSATFADNMDIAGLAAITFSSTANVTVNLSNTAKTFGNISFPATTTRTITLNSATNAAITQSLGILTVGNSATLNFNGASTKIMAGLSLGATTTTTFAGSYVYNGSVSVGTNSRFPSGWSNNTFNGNVLLNVSPNILNLANNVFNANATIYPTGNMGSCTLASGVILTLNYFVIGAGNTFATGSGISTNTYVRVSTASGNTFANNWTVNGTAVFDGNLVLDGTLTLNNNAGFTFNNNPTINGTLTTGTGVTGNFVGSASFSKNVTIAGTSATGVTFRQVSFVSGANLAIGSSASAIVNFVGTANNTLQNVTVGNNSQVDFSNTGTNTFNTVTLSPGVSWEFSTGGLSTINGDFQVLNPACGGALVNINSNTGSSQAIVDFNAFSNPNNVYISNINNTGPIITIANGAGNNNTNITIPATLPSRTLYWVGGPGNWNDASHWSATSGGAGGQCPPTIIDDVNFNNNSFTANSQTVTINVDAACRNMNWAATPAITRTPILSGAAARVLTVAGNLTLISGMTQTGTGSTFLGKVVFAGNATGRTINMNGKVFASVEFNGLGGGWSLSNNFTVVNGINLIAGELDATTRVISASSLTVNNVSDLTRSLKLGTATHTLSGSGTVLDLQGNSANFTLNPGTSTINMTNSSAIVIETGSEAKTLPNLTIPSSNSITINTSNTTNRISFGNINASGNVTRTFTVNGAAPKSYGDITINGSNNTLVFNGSSNTAPNNNQFGAFTLTAGRTGTAATFNGSNIFNGAVDIHGTSGNARSVIFSETNTFNNTFTASLASTAGTELQFASTSGSTTFNDDVSLNPGNTTAVDVIFNNANSFAAGKNLTIGQNTNTTFQGIGVNAFAIVTVNASSIFNLNNDGNSTFTSATINSQTGSGVTWYFRSGRQATFSGNMTIAATCSSPVNIGATIVGTRARASFAAAQYFNNEVYVQDIDATVGANINTYVSVVPASPNNLNVTYNNGVSNRTLYWVGNTNNWSNSLSWSTTSGGPGGACMPTASDDVVFNGASFSGSGQIATINIATATCRNMTWTDGQIPVTTIFAMGGNPLEINGNLSLARNLAVTGTSATNSVFNFTTNVAAVNTSSNRTITCPAGITAALPAALFNSAGITWTLNGSGNFEVTNQLGLQAGTLNTNSLAVACGALNANLSGTTRVLNIANSAINVTGSSANGFAIGLDFRGSNFTFNIPGASSSLTFSNPAGYVQVRLDDNTTRGVNPGSPRTLATLRTMPDIILQNRDIDILTSDYNVTDGIANRTTFRTITNVNGGQFYVSGTCPHTYGAITVANNLNANGLDQRRIVGSSQPSPNNNIFNGPVTFGTNCGFSFEGNNVFNNTFTFASTVDANDALRFTENNVFNGVVDITGTNLTRVTSTVHFVSGGTGAITFNNDVNFHGSISIFRFSGSTTLAATKTMTFDTESIGWFVGGGGINVAGEPIPGNGSYNFAGNLVLNPQARTIFYNTTNNTYSNVTLSDYSVFDFSSLSPVSTVTGVFSATGNCNVWKQINASIPGDPADITFSNNQNWTFVLARDLNVIGIRSVTANNSTNVGNSCTGLITFTSIPTTGTLVWVGGDPSNTSGDSKWSNPKNWASPPLNATNRKNGGTCIPSSLNDVVFNNVSFSSTPQSGAKYYDRVIVDIPVATCANMTWDSSIPGSGQSKLMTDASTNELWVHGSLVFKSIMENQFTGTFSFRYPITLGLVEQTITSDAVPFKGPVEINSVGATYRLVDPMVINATDIGGVQRGNFSIINGNLKSSGNNINLSGNWTIAPPVSLNPQGMFYHQNNTVTFDGKDAVNGTQNIIAATSPFWNLVINRGSKPSPVDVIDGNLNNRFRWVLIQNRRGLSTSNATPIFGIDPGNTANSNQPFDSGITVENNLNVTQGGLYDKGYQIIGSTGAGVLSITDNGVLSIGSGNVNSGTSNNNPMTNLFPTNYTRARISLTTGSTVSYSARGHQDVSNLPVYGNLYFRNVVSGSIDGLATLTSSTTFKRLSLGTNSLSLTVNGTLTVEKGILFYDMGNQINVGASASLQLQSGGTLMLGSGVQTVATTTGSGYAPLANTTGTTLLSAAATTFPAFTNANINIDVNSNIVYASSLAQDIKGDLNSASAQRYGNLVLVNPAASSTTLIQKTIQTGAIQVNSLIIHPSNNLVDNGLQVNGTTGAYFVMNYKSDPLSMPFNGQTPTSSGVTTSATPFDLSTKPVATVDNFGYRFDGYIKITNPGTYTFYTTSDDGSMLAVNGTTVVNNNYDQGATTRSGTILLAAGTYPITVTYHQGNGSSSLLVEWQGPSIARAAIPSSVVSATATGTTGGVNYYYYEAPAGVNYNITSGYNAGSLPLKTFTDLSRQSVTSTTQYTGESRMVVGTVTAATTFPTNYANTDINFDLGTSFIYNASLPQVVKGLNSAIDYQEYASLILTNTVASSPKVVPKTLDNIVTVREKLTINPNNNFIDNGFQINGTLGQVFSMNNATLATNPVTNSGTVGTTGESRITLGTATIATTFPTGYSLSATDVNFELGTTVVYNAGVSQNIARLMNTATSAAALNSRYANLMLTNPVTTTPARPVLKTLLSNSITVRGNLVINPNNTLYDAGRQITGTSGQTFGMYNATRPADPWDGTLIGATGESRFVIGTTGTNTTFPGGFRTGSTFGTNSDINFEENTTVVYNSGRSATGQVIQGLGGVGTTTYSNLTLTNPVTSGAALVNKTLQTQSTTVRGDLTINPNNNFLDGGYQIAGVAGKNFIMNNATRASNPIGTGTAGMVGESRLTLGTSSSPTAFPLNYVTVQTGGTTSDINFETDTWVVYNGGQNQPVKGIIDNTSLTSNANYAQLSFVNSAASGTVDKTLTGNARVRQNLTIGGITSAASSGQSNRLDASSSNYKINLGGDWYTHATNGFNARSGEVELEGTTLQTVTTQNAQNFTSEASTQDFYRLTINNTTALPSVAVNLGSNVGVSNTITFQQGLVQSASLSGATLNNSPTTGLLIVRHNATASNASDNSFVLGAVRKVGQVTSGTFYFPIGYINGSTPYYRPSGVSNMSDANGAYISQFYFWHPTQAGFATTSKQNTVVGVSQPLLNVSAREFWMVNRENSGSGTAFVSLTWRNPESGGVGTNGVATNYLGLRVSRWNGSMWQNLGGDASKFVAYNGSLSNVNGSLTSQYNTAGTVGAVNNFSPFTLASEIDFNPLPVTMIDFKAQSVNGQVQLNWQTANELNTAHFVIERSQDGKVFEMVTTKAAAGNSSELSVYQALDAKPYSGLSYYRLKIVDLDGKVSYSKVVQVTIGVGGSLGEVVLYPNPTEGRNINIKVNNANIRVLAVHDLLGRMVGYRTGWNSDGSLAVDFTQVLAKGTYVAVITTQDGSQTFRLKFIVQ